MRDRHRCDRRDRAWQKATPRSKPCAAHHRRNRWAECTPNRRGRGFRQMCTFDESRGLYDSGYIQPIYFFGDGPRTVLIAVSPFAKHGHVDHTYADHASILKFMEWNWNLPPLSSRSRDNLPNPVSAPNAPYFPTNSPAIGDLRSMFAFARPSATPRPNPTPRG